MIVEVYCYNYNIDFILIKSSCLDYYVILRKFLFSSSSRAIVIIEIASFSDSISDFESYFSILFLASMISY